MKLAKNERIVAAWASPANGPGWANAPIQVLIQRIGGPDYRMEWIQPQDQTDEMHYLYAVSAAVHGAMTAAVERAARKP